MAELDDDVLMARMLARGLRERGDEDGAAPVGRPRAPLLPPRVRGHLGSAPTLAPSPSSTQRCKADWPACFRESTAPQEAIIGTLQELLRVASEFPLEPITVDMLDSALAHTSASKAKGIDNLAASASGGDSVLGVLATVAKTWSKARSTATDRWAEAEHHWWDAAIKGSSALRAAIVRFMMDETALAMGFARCGPFVENAVAGAEGAQGSSRSTILGASVALKEGLDPQNLTVSGKTAPMSSHPALGRELSRALQRRGIPCQAAVAAVDIGVDVAAGRRRPQRRTEARKKAAHSMSRRIARMRKQVRLSRLTKALWSTAAQPKAARGRQALGLAPIALLRLRRSAAASAAARGPDRCLAGLLGALRGGEGPAIESRALTRTWVGASAVETELILAVKKQPWSKASRHRHGADLRDGADARGVLREQRRFMAKGMLDSCSQNLIVIAGGLVASGSPGRGGAPAPRFNRDEADRGVKIGLDVEGCRDECWHARGDAAAVRAARHHDPLALGHLGQLFQPAEDADRMLQQAIEASRKAHLVAELPREKYNPDCHHDLQECELCLVEYEVGDELMRLPCMHLFHSACVAPWLQKANSCPVCQTDTLE
ncbi:unnamed protein product, partial [Prorocentrum cordatum]